MKFYTDIGARDTAFSADVIRRIEGPKTIRSGCEEAPSFHRLVFVQVEKNFQLLEKAHHIASLVIVVRRESNPFQNEVFFSRVPIGEAFAAIRRGEKEVELEVCVARGARQRRQPLMSRRKPGRRAGGPRRPYL